MVVGGNMQDKGYYTLLEILMAMRGEYLKCQELLSNMKSDITITDKDPYIEAYLSLVDRCIEIDYSNYDYKGVNLFIRRDPRSGVGPYVRNLLKCLPIMQLFSRYDIANYDLRKDHDKYCFENVEFNPIYNPTVVIPDNLQNDFHENFVKIGALDLYRLPEKVFNIRDYSTMTIDGSGFNTYPEHDIHQVSYDARNDKIVFNTRFIDEIEPEALIDVLNTEVPTYRIPKEVLKYLEKHAAEPLEVEGNEPFRKHGEYYIKAEDKKIVLIKSLKK